MRVKSKKIWILKQKLLSAYKANYLKMIKIFKINKLKNFNKIIVKWILNNVYLFNKKNLLLLSYIYYRKSELILSVKH